jgi:DNA-directed RNA polymerase subunit RPC12/RpoP/predicted RNA-binding Zn-ribbon protein involved in translation (DUF1610 family)
MVTICSNCGHDLSDRESEDKYVVCPFCNRFIPKGAHSYQGKVKKIKGQRLKSVKLIDMKGGSDKNMVESKSKKTKTSTPKVKKEKSFSPERSLTCSVCGKIKRAGKKRVEKWKGKTYVCRECRAKLKIEEEKKNKESSKK